MVARKESMSLPSVTIPALVVSRAPILSQWLKSFKIMSQIPCYTIHRVFLAWAGYIFFQDLKLFIDIELVQNLLCTFQLDHSENTFSKTKLFLKTI